MVKNLKLGIIALLMALAAIPDLYGGPARFSEAIYTQPDGSTFAVKVRGDEWLCIRTTMDGCPIVRDEAGWWCYGTYNEDGRLVCSGYRVGEAAPAELLADSRNIPYKKLADRATERRRKVSHADRSALEAVRRQNMLKTKGSPVPVRKRGLAILAQFQDVKFRHTKEDFHKLLNEQGYNGTGSAKDYYEDQFGDGWEFSFDVSEIITLPYDLKYYGENDPPGDDNGTDIRPATMAWHACKGADEYVDFSIYDQDEDGTVDNVYIFYAGYDESENSQQTDLLWAHQYYIRSGSEYVYGTERLDGVWVDRYACSSELSSNGKITGIGTFCHEYMHTFGVPDFYDTNYDYDGTWAAGLWKRTSLMDGGNYNNRAATPPNLNCIERMLLGLSEPVGIEAGNTYTLEPVHKSGQSYMMASGTDGEYYLFECRSNEGWDSYIGGQGMLVYHIDENAEEYVDGYGMVSKWEYNTVNADQSHQCADLIEADGRSDAIDEETSYNDLKGIFYPQQNITSITPESNGTYRYWNGSAPETSLVGITGYDGGIRFKAVSNDDVPEIPDIAGFDFKSFPDAIFITFEASTGGSGETALLEWNRHDDTHTETATIRPSQDGKYSYLITGLESGSVLYDIKVRFNQEGIDGNSYMMSVMTKRSPVTWPYFYMTSGEISLAEGMVAHVVNSSKAKEKVWYLDGRQLPVGDDCRIRPDKAGCLSCEIRWADGSTDTIVKEITITE